MPRQLFTLRSWRQAGKLFAALTLCVALIPAAAGIADNPAFAASSTSKQKLSKKQARDARQKRLAAVNSWGYQLRFVDANEVSRSPYDLMVIDHAISANRRFQRQITRQEIETMKRRPDGSRRIVLSYLSIGEAERYRFYWHQAWYDKALAPPWLSSMNPNWDGNYLVRFWDPAWQALIYGGPQTYLQRIQDQGFDGIYLDRADVYEELKQERPGGARDMVRFIGALADAARASNPQFLVVMQNAEELLRYKKLSRSIDAIAKEDLFFGVEEGGKANSRDDVSWSLKWLKRARKRGKKVFVVEYLNDAGLAAKTMKRIADHAFIPYAAPRGLGSLWFPGRDF